MIKRYNIKDLNKIKENVSCIGFFDGVHLGHQELIKKTIKLAKIKNVEPYIITFSNDPKSIIAGRTSTKINSLSSRIKLFDKFGIKGVIIIDFDEKLMNLKPKEFVNKYLKKFNLKGLVCGYDFHYGRSGLGNYKSLKADLKNTCDVFVVKEVKYYGKKVSSLRIKEELDKKNYKLVNKLLGYKYER